MRLSINTKDPGYRNDAGFYDIFFNGVILRNAITADEEARTVLCYVLDDRGQPVKHPDKPSTYMTETKKGEVHIQRRAATMRNGL